MRANDLGDGGRRVAVRIDTSHNATILPADRALWERPAYPDDGRNRFVRARPPETRALVSQMTLGGWAPAPRGCPGSPFDRTGSDSAGAQYPCQAVVLPRTWGVGWFKSDGLSRTRRSSHRVELVVSDDDDPNPRSRARQVDCRLQ